ncbi:MAG: DUF4132 domain-containing protein [Sandaracinaceae bacterium]
MSDESGYERRRHARKLERAMGSRRSWSIARFMDKLARGGPFAQLAEAVLFEGESAVRFRIERGRPIGVDGGLVELPPGEIRVAHPLDLEDGELGAWGDHFAQHGVLSPFAQLARPTRVPRDGTSVPAATGEPIAATVLARGLEERGYAPGPPNRRLRVDGFVRRFGPTDPRARIAIEPGLRPARAPDLARASERSSASERALEAQRITGACFVRGGEAAPLSLADVPPRVISEVMFDLGVLAGLTDVE